MSATVDARRNAGKLIGIKTNFPFFLAIQPAKRTGKLYLRLLIKHLDSLRGCLVHIGFRTLQTRSQGMMKIIN